MTSDRQSPPSFAEMIALAHAVDPALRMLEVVAHKPIQGEAMHKVIGYHAYNALRHVAWMWPGPLGVPLFLPNDGGEPPPRDGIQKVYVIGGDPG